MKKELIITFFITILSYNIFFFQNYLLAHAIHLEISFFSIAPIISITMLIGYIPISIGGLGTREAILILLFQQIGHSAEEALGFAVLFNLVYIGFGGLMGFGVWWLFPLKPLNIKK
jgi:uncharacterized protein (TIRG00374 family)